MVSLFTLGINLIVCISTLLSCVFPSPSTCLLALTPMESLSTLCPFSTQLASCLPTSFCAHQTPLILDNNPTLQLLSQLHVGLIAGCPTHMGHWYRLSWVWVQVGILPPTRIPYLQVRVRWVGAGFFFIVANLHHCHCLQLWTCHCL